MIFSPFQRHRRPRRLAAVLRVPEPEAEIGAGIIRALAVDVAAVVLLVHADGIDRYAVSAPDEA